MRVAWLGCYLLCAAANCLGAAYVPIPFQVRNAVSFGFTWVQAGFDGLGNLYVASVVNFNGPPPANATQFGPACSICMVVAKVTNGSLAQMTTIGGFVFGTPQFNAYSETFGMYVDPGGDVFLAGGFAGASFPTTAGALVQSSATGGAYLLKLDDSLTKLRYSTFLGSNPIETLATSIALDPQGDVYVAGITGETTFPTTPGALQQSGSTDQGPMFVTKFSPAGKLLASTLFGGGAQGYSGEINGMAIDGSGVVHIAGGMPGGLGGFVARLNASLSQVVYSVSLSDQPQSIQASSAGDTYIAGNLITKISAGGSIVYQTPLATGGAGLAVLKDGTVMVGGSANAPNFPTRNSIEACLPDRTTSPGPGPYPASGVFAVLDPTGNITFSTYLGGLAGTAITGVTLDPSGNVYLAGWTNGYDFPDGPVLAGGFGVGTAFVFELDLSSLPQGYPTAACLGTPFSYLPLAPGFVSLTLYGSGLGPTAGVSFQLDANGNIPTQLAGMSVQVGALAAPILYAQDQQINFIVPEGIVGDFGPVCVSSVTTVWSGCLWVAATPLLPQVFYTLGKGYAVLNQDGTLNTPVNPAARGSYVTLFGTGMGLYDRSLMDGSIVGAPVANLVTPVSATFLDPTPVPPECGQPLQPACPVLHNTTGTVLFAGAAPGEVVGVTQIDVLIPTATMPGPAIVLSLGFGQTNSINAAAVLAIQ